MSHLAWQYACCARWYALHVLVCKKLCQLLHYYHRNCVAAVVSLLLLAFALSSWHICIQYGYFATVAKFAAAVLNYLCLLLGQPATPFMA
jgi:hypothetical protein